VWLQAENSLNTTCEQLSLVTLCVSIFRLYLFQILLITGCDSVLPDGDRTAMVKVQTIHAGATEPLEELCEQQSLTGDET